MSKIFCFFFLSTFALGAEISSVNFVQQGEVSQLVIGVVGDVSYDKSELIDKKQIILDLNGVSATKRVLRSINTSEFSGSMVYVSGFQRKTSPTDIRFVIQLRDNVQSRVKTTPNQVVLEVENRFGAFASAGEDTTIPTAVGLGQAGGAAGTEQVYAVDEQAETKKEISDILENLTSAGNKKYFGRKISVNVKKLPITDLLNMIAQISGFNILISADASARPDVTLGLNNVPWDEALDVILKLNNLVAIKRLNILQILTQEKFIADEQKKIEAIKAKKTLDPLETRIFSINFSELSEILVAIEGQLTKDRGKVTSDKRTSKIIVKDTAKQLDRISTLIKELDIQTPQVLIEAKIIETTESEVKRYGLNGGLTGSGTLPASSGTANSAAFTFNTTGSGLLDLTIVRNFGRIRGILDLMERETKTRVLTAPRVVTKDNQAATISATNEISYATGQTVDPANPANSVTTFATASASLNLQVTPKVSNDGTINLNINVSNAEFDELPSEGSNQPPPVSNSSVTTNVLVENGSTVVIGGLYKTRSQNTVEGVPVLKDIPILGWLFRSSHVERPNRRELMVFITPRIINKFGDNTEVSQVVE